MTNRKNIMEEFILKEISIVDVAAQEPATVVISKSHKDETIDKEILKMSDDKIKALEVALAKAQKMATMTDAHKAHYAGLSDTDKDSFLALDNTGRDEAIAIAKSANPVVYTAHDGTLYYKSDDQRLVKMARERDTDRAALKVERERLEEARIDDILKSDLAGLPGDDNVRKAIVKSLDTIKDAAVKTAAYNVIKELARETFGVFTRKSLQTSPNVDLSKAALAESELQKLADTYAKTHKVSNVIAMNEVLKTAEGAQLYNQSIMM